MPILKVLILAIVQGLAELLPVSSSAHVVVAEKLMHLDPGAPEMTLLLVMLHTGTMFAVIAYFWRRWKMTYFRSTEAFTAILVRIVLASVLTAVVGYPIIKVIEHGMAGRLGQAASKAEIENLFGRLDLVAGALFCAGVLILIAGLAERRKLAAEAAVALEEMPDRRGRVVNSLTLGQSGLIGAVQGLCLPFRGFSRSGATISAGMLGGVPRQTAETFSFALAVVLTPPAIAREVLRLLKASHAASGGGGAARFAWGDGGGVAGSCVQLCGGVGGAAVVIELVGIGEVVFVWNLLPSGFGGGVLFVYGGVLGLDGGSERPHLNR